MAASNSTTGAGNVGLPSPEVIGFFVRSYREMQGWTQETLAELARVEVRTIQRVERGTPSSLDTRRAIAAAFKLDDIDIFNKPITLPDEEQLKKQKEAFDRDYLLLESQVVDGRTLMHLIADGPGFSAMHAASTAELPRDVQDAFAPIVDFVRDSLDIADEVSETELLVLGDALDDLIASLLPLGFCICAAQRNTRITNKTWTDPTPMALTVTYVIATPKAQPAKKLAVLRQLTPNR